MTQNFDQSNCTEEEDPQQIDNKELYLSIIHANNVQLLPFKYKEKISLAAPNVFGVINNDI